MNQGEKYVSIVIPVYNEEKMVEKQVRFIADEMERKLAGKYEIIISENGSKDDTLNICNRLGENKNIKVISNGIADYGMALRNSMLCAKGKMIVNFDIDYYDIGFLFQSLALEPFGYDVIVASKNAKLSVDGRKFLRKLISGLYKYALYYGFGLRVSDTHGIKAWRNDTKLKELIEKTVNNKEIFDTELIIRSQYAGRKLLELPVEIVEMRKSVSSIFKRSLRGFFQISKLWFNFNVRNKI